MKQSNLNFSPWIIIPHVLLHLVCVVLTSELVTLFLFLSGKDYGAV